MNGDSLSGLPELPAPTNRYEFLGMRYFGSRYHYDNSGALVGKENIYDISDETGQSITFLPKDRAGNNIGEPDHAAGFRLEGSSGISGVAYRTIERDNLYRPKKVFGYQVTEGFAGKLGRAFFRQSLGPDAVDEFTPGAYEEITFEYDDTTGLLNCVTEEIHEGLEVTRTKHQNFFDSDGIRIGYLKQHFVDVSPDGAEVYDLSELHIYEYGDGRWKETAYSGFRDGMVPWLIKEGPIGRPEDTTYLTDAAQPQLQAYKIAHSPDVATLTEHIEALTMGDRKAELPAWILKADAYDVAAGRVSIADAASQPDFPETHDTEILLPEAALHLAGECDDAESTCEFINSLTAQDKVILHPIFYSDKLVTRVAVETYAHSKYSDIQKVSVLASLHPAFCIDELNPADLPETQNHRRYFDILMKALNTDKTALSMTLLQFGYRLSPRSTAVFEFLMSEKSE